MMSMFIQDSDSLSEPPLLEANIAVIWFWLVLDVDRALLGLWFWTCVDLLPIYQEYPEGKTQTDQIYEHLDLARCMQGKMHDSLNVVGGGQLIGLYAKKGVQRGGHG